MDQQEILSSLYRKYLAGACTDQERQTFMDLIRQPGMEPAIQSLIQQQLELVDAGELPITRELAAERVSAIFEQVLAASPETPVVTMAGRTNHRLRWVAAAAVIILLLSVAGYWLLKDKKPAKEVVQTKQPEDILAPERNHATIKLADGQKIMLHDAADGTVAIEQGAQLVKTGNGVIEYQATDQATGTVQYNTLENPRGSQVINMLLADGSRVWLNAGSSVTYPVVFNGSTRNVSITGEAYFEVASLPLTPSGGAGTKGNAPAPHGKMPFIVDVAGKAVVEVLGTHFNINAYDDEENIKTTLLEGKVKVSVTQPQTTNQKPQTVLSPGQQAILTNNKLQTTNKVNTGQIMAWKNGYFSFRDTDIKTLMRQLSRWYNVEVSYKGTIPNKKFSGEIGRSLTLKEVLDGLAFTDIKFSIEEGRKLIILPQP